MGEERSALQKFIREIQRRAPERHIAVFPAVKATVKKGDKDVEIMVAGRAYSEADEFLDDVEAGKPLHVQVMDLGNFQGSPETILTAVEEAVAE